MAKHPPRSGDPVVVIGLGRFGGRVAESLVRLGHDVLAIDEDPEIVHRLADEFTHVVQADSTDVDALRQLGVADFGIAVVGIGTDIEASVLTVLALDELGVGEIWAKAVTARHGHILTRIGAKHVVYPEVAMGERVAHLVTGKMIDFIEFEDEFAIVKTRVPPGAAGRSLADVALRTRYGVTVVGVKRSGEDFVQALPDTVLRQDDMIIVSGPTEAVQRFAAST